MEGSSLQPEMVPISLSVEHVDYGYIKAVASIFEEAHA